MYLYSTSGRRGEVIQAQDPHRGPSAEEGHGVHRRSGAGGRDEGPRQLLDIPGGVPGEGGAGGPGEAHAWWLLIRKAALG